MEDDSVKTISDKLVDIQTDVLQKLYTLSTENNLEFSYMVTILAANLVHDAIDLETLWKKETETE